MSRFSCVVFLLVMVLLATIMGDSEDSELTDNLRRTLQKHCGLSKPL